MLGDLLTDMHYAQDTREQTPWILPGVRHVTKLDSGDYSSWCPEENRPLEELVSIERKTLPDFLSCVTTSRDRFKRELQRLTDSCQQPWIIVESPLAAIAAGNYRSKVTPQSVVGSVESWSRRYLPVWIFAADCMVAALTAWDILCVNEGRIQQWRQTRNGSTCFSARPTSSTSSSTTELMPHREVAHHLGLTGGLLTVAR